MNWLNKAANINLEVVLVSELMSEGRPEHTVVGRDRVLCTQNYLD